MDHNLFSHVNENPSPTDDLTQNPMSFQLVFSDTAERRTPDSARDSTSHRSGR